MNIPPDEDTEGVYLIYVTDAPAMLGVGDGATFVFPLTQGGQEMISANLFGLWRSDWQGNQALYATQRTNALLRSQQPASTPWNVSSGACVVTNNAALAPDGTNTAATVATTGTSDYLYQTITSAGTQAWSASAIVQGVTTTALTLSIYWLSGGVTQNVAVEMNPSTGSVVGTSTNIAQLTNYSVTPLPNGWWRVSVSGIGTDPADTQAQFRLQDTTGGTASYYLWGNQIETGSIPTGYIPTTVSPNSMTDYTFDPLSGLIKFTTPPVLGAILTWMGNYLYETAETPDWKDSIASQYATSPIITALIASFEDCLDPEQNIDSFYNLMWNVDTAMGYGLDVWGRIVGVTRVVSIPSTTAKYLGFEEAGGTHIEPFNSAVFYNVTGPALINFALSDSLYRMLIMVKALMNISRTTTQTYNQALMTLFPGLGNCYVVETGPMAAQLTFPTALSAVQKAMLQQTGVFTPPTGVKFTVYP